MADDIHGHQYDVGGLGGVLKQGAAPLQGMLAQALIDRRAARELNPLRQALLQSQPAGGYTGPMANQEAIDAQAARTPMQQMIMQAAQDPKQFGQLAQHYGPLELGAAMTPQTIRSRELIVHPGDDLDKQFRLGLQGEESAIIKLNYDNNDRMLPGFEVKDYKNPRATGDGHYGSANVGEIMFINDQRKAAGLPPLTPPETEARLNEMHQTAGAQQNYRRYAEQEKAAKREPMSFEDWLPTFGAAQGLGATTGTEVAKRLNQQENDAQVAVRSLNSAENAFALIDKGIIAGTGAEPRLALVRAIDTLMGRTFDAKSAATDAYQANQGTLVGETIKNFGAGTGLSDADREFAKLVSGASLFQSPQALKMALEIMVRGKLGQINQFNDKLGKLQGSFAALAPFYDKIIPPESIYARISPLVKAPENMPDAEKLQFYLNQRPSYLPQGSNPQLPPGATPRPQPNAAPQPPGPGATPEQIIQFYQQQRQQQRP